MLKGVLLLAYVLSYIAGLLGGLLGENALGV